jgi:hypothetical protein
MEFACTFEGRHERIRALADPRDRREVPYRVKRQAGVETVIDGVRSYRRHQDGIAVGRALCREIRRDVAAGPATVVYHQRLAELLAHLRLHGARDDIRRAPGWKRDEHADRP